MVNPRFLSLALFAITSFFSAAFGQLHVVGYINQALYSGDNLIANQLYNGSNDLSTIFSSVPDGSTVAKWNYSSHLFLPTSTYTSGTGWSIDYTLVAGEGALFNAPVNFTNTYVGEIHGYNGDDRPITYQYPSLTPGVALFSCSFPKTATFQEIIGRDPVENESVRRLNAMNGNYFTTTFRNGAWDNNAPALAVGESGYFTIVQVPEPSGLWLIIAGLGMGILPRLFSINRTRYLVSRE